MISWLSAKCRAPCLKTSKNFKLVRTEHQTKPKALVSVGPARPHRSHTHDVALAGREKLIKRHTCQGSEWGVCNAGKKWWQQGFTEGRREWGYQPLTQAAVSIHG